MPSSELLAKYADVCIQIGIGLEPGDRLLIHSPVGVVEFTRTLVEQAYGAGAVNVDVLWTDDFVSRARYERGSAESWKTVSTASHARLAALEAGDKLLYVHADDPDAMAGIDPGRLAAFQRVNREALAPLVRAQGTLERAWTVVAAPSATWARSVFPEATTEDAIESLWSAIFRACRADQGDPVAAWRAHVADLSARAGYLTSRTYTGLRYEGPGTDLRLGLPDRPVWVGGSNDGPFVPNIPTEEVFCGPNRMAGEGTVAATKPLSLFGNLVEGFSFELSEGKIVWATAEKGQDVLDQLLATDDGSMRFGECAMVPMSSAVAAEGLIWSNTLYDENDGCHIAIGQAYPINIDGGTAMSPAELHAAGLNQSTAHVDFVVGSPDLDVYGITPDGAEEPIITGGEWGFDAQP